jgi:hypothetical protein
MKAISLVDGECTATAGGRLQRCQITDELTVCVRRGYFESADGPVYSIRCWLLATLDPNGIDEPETQTNQGVAMKIQTRIKAGRRPRIRTL